MALAWRVAEAMADHGVTVDQVLERAHMSKMELARLMGEEGLPVKAVRLTTLDALSSAIGCGIEELFKQVDEAFVPGPEPKEEGGTPFWRRVRQWFGDVPGTKETAKASRKMGQAHS